MDKNDIEREFSGVFSQNNVSGSKQTFTQQLTNKYGFRAMHDKIVQNMMSHIISWVLTCFDKYDEDTFHKKMDGMFAYSDNHLRRHYYMHGFDFVGDWRTNHGPRTEKIIKAIRITKAKIDREATVQAILGTMKKRGWTILPHEERCFRFTIFRLYNLIYNNVDSVAPTVR